MTMIDTTTLPLVPDECLWRWPARCWPAPTGSRGSRALVADVDPVLGYRAMITAALQVSGSAVRSA